MNKSSLNFVFTDIHCHTQYAYCGDGITAISAIERGKKLGLKHLYFTEHSGQLYLSNEDFWSARFINNPDLLRDGKTKDFYRMNKYRQEMFNIRSDFVKIGLEVDCDCNGKITLLEEDKKGLDILLGACHWLPEKFCSRGGKETEKGFMWVTENLLKEKVDVLVHPFRFFVRSKLETPVHLYKPVVELLANYNVCAEINFHTNTPDPKFFEMCLENKVKIAFGSDSHELEEVGEFSRHLELLKEIGALNKLPEIIWNNS